MISLEMNLSRLGWEDRRPYLDHDGNMGLQAFPYFSASNIFLLVGRNGNLEVSLLKIFEMET